VTSFVNRCITMATQ